MKNNALGNPRRAAPRPGQRGKSLLAAALLVPLLSTTTLELLAATPLPERKLSLHLRDKTLAQVLAEVKRATNLAIAYPADEVRKVQHVSVDADNQTPGRVLRHVLAGTGLAYKELGASLVIYKVAPAAETRAPAQQEPVQGMVLDENGQPLPGGAVRLKGATSGATTDANGAFTFTDLPVDTTLIISYVGYRAQEVRYEPGAALAIRLEPDQQQLQEAMVTGCRLFAGSPPKIRSIVA